MARFPALSHSAAIALDLAGRHDGYLAPGSDVIDELRREGLVTTQNVGDGFMLVRAVRRPQPRLASHKWFWPQEGVSA